MTTDNHQHLGDRLEGLAVNFMSDIELTHPTADALSVATPRIGKRGLLLIANAAVIVLVGLALWARSSSPETDEVTTSLADQLPAWTEVSPGIDVEGWLDGIDLTQLFDLSIVRQIDFEAGAVFVGLDPEGRNVVIAVGSRADADLLASTTIRLPDLFRRQRTFISSVGSPNVTTVGGVAPAGAVAVLANGERFELQDGAFLLEYPPFSDFPRIEFEFADGRVEGPQPGLGVGAPGATGSLSATIEGSFADVELTSVNCAQMSSDPVEFEFSAASGSPLVLGDSLGMALIDGVLLFQGVVEGELVGAGVSVVDLEVNADASGTLKLAWETDTTSGSASISCGSFIIDAAELRALLRSD